MKQLNIEEITTSNIDRLFIDGIEEIPIITSINITNDNYGKIDQIILKYYRDIKYLPLIISFNKVIDIVNIPIGFNFKIPDINELMNNCYLLDEEDSETYSLPGINKSTNNYNVNLDNLKSGKKGNKTTALPKLKITKNKVRYNSTTGELIF